MRKVSGLLKIARTKTNLYLEIKSGIKEVSHSLSVMLEALDKEFAGWQKMSKHPATGDEGAG